MCTPVSLPVCVCLCPDWPSGAEGPFRHSAPWWLCGSLERLRSSRPLRLSAPGARWEGLLGCRVALRPFANHLCRESTGAQPNTHTSTHPHQALINVCARARMSVCTRAYVNVHVCVCVCVYVCTGVYVSVCVCVHGCECVCMCAQVCV